MPITSEAVVYCHECGDLLPWPLGGARTCKEWCDAFAGQNESLGRDTALDLDMLAYFCDQARVPAGVN